MNGFSIRVSSVGSRSRGSKIVFRWRSRAGRSGHSQGPDRGGRRPLHRTAGWWKSRSGPERQFFCCQGFSVPGRSGCCRLGRRSGQSCPRSTGSSAGRPSITRPGAAIRWMLADDLVPSAGVVRDVATICGRMMAAVTDEGAPKALSPGCVSRSGKIDGATVLARWCAGLGDPTRAAFHADAASTTGQGRRITGPTGPGSASPVPMWMRPVGGANGQHHRLAGGDPLWRPSASEPPSPSR